MLVYVFEHLQDTCKSKVEKEEKEILNFTFIQIIYNDHKGKKIII